MTTMISSSFKRWCTRESKTKKISKSSKINVNTRTKSKIGRATAAHSKNGKAPVPITVRVKTKMTMVTKTLMISRMMGRRKMKVLYKWKMWVLILRKVYLQMRTFNFRKAHIKKTRDSWYTNSTRIIQNMTKNSSLMITNFKRKMSFSTLKRQKASIKTLWNLLKKQWWVKLMRLIRKSSKS